MCVCVCVILSPINKGKLYIWLKLSLSLYIYIYICLISFLCHFLSVVHSFFSLYIYIYIYIYIGSEFLVARVSECVRPFVYQFTDIVQHGFSHAFTDAMIWDTCVHKSIYHRCAYLSIYYSHHINTLIQSHVHTIIRCRPFLFSYVRICILSYGNVFTLSNMYASTCRQFRYKHK